MTLLRPVLAVAAGVLAGSRVGSQRGTGCGAAACLPQGCVARGHTFGVSQRRWVSVRVAEPGYEYVRRVAESDGVSLSEALRRLLALGAQADAKSRVAASDNASS